MSIVISDGSKIILFRFSNTKFSYSRKTVLQCWYLNLISLLYEHLGLFGYFRYLCDLWRHWGVNIVHMKIWFTPLNLSRFNYYKFKLTLKMGMISSISGNLIILVYIGIILGIGALAHQWRHQKNGSRYISRTERAFNMRVFFVRLHFWSLKTYQWFIFVGLFL